MKVIHVYSVPDDVFRTLRTRASAAGVSLSAYALAELERVARRPTVKDLLARANARESTVETATIVDAIRKGRD